jgi:hypothetical protein
MSDNVMKISVSMPVKLAREAKACAAFRGIPVSKVYEDAVREKVAELLSEAKAQAE